MLYHDYSACSCCYGYCASHAEAKTTSVKVTLERQRVFRSDIYSRPIYVFYINTYIYMFMCTYIYMCRYCAYMSVCLCIDTCECCIRRHINAGFSRATVETNKQP